MKKEEYKKLSIKEFTKAASIYESDNAGFFESVKRCLKPGGRLILRDMTTDSKVVGWLVDHIEMPLAHLAGHGDYKMASRKAVIECAKVFGADICRFAVKK